MRKSSFLLALSALFAVASFALDVPVNKLVDAAWLKKNIADKSLVLVMGERDGTYAKKHIANSDKWSSVEFGSKTAEGILLDIPSPEKFTQMAQKSGINADSVVVFYGSGTDALNEAKAAEALIIAEYYGVKKTAILNGGLAAWEKSGGAVTAEVPADKKGTYKAGKTTDVITTLDKVDAAVKAKSATFVDARAEKFFNGTDTDKRLGQHGKIENAVSIPVTTLYTITDGIAYMKKADEIKALFKAANVDLTKPVISYCNTGHLAAAVWFAGKYQAGIKNIRDYKGSMVEYSNTKPARNVVK